MKSPTLLLSLLALASCGDPLPPPSTELSTAREDGLYGLLGGLEFAADAPWRLEPEVNCVKSFCSTQYDAVPLSIVFRDAYQGSFFGSVSVTGVRVEELDTGLPPLDVPLSSFHEVERTVGVWRKYNDDAVSGPPHQVCRRWRGESCEGFEQLSGTSEWDGTVFYTLRQTPVRNSLVRLKVTALVLGVTGTSKWSNTVIIKLGDALPRFDTRWVYGDLHYHSQGTDNEGESGYSHRTTLHAMAALGLDFAFATEHASNSGQFDDYSDTVVREGRILRDMNQQRFTSLLAGLNGAGGANEQVASRPRRRSSSALAVPQLFLGGEVDVIPEMGIDDYNFGIFFGVSNRYQYGRACYEFPAAQELVTLDIPYTVPCPNGVSDLLVPAYDTETRQPVANRWFLRDVQGPLELRFGRQHMLHLPSDTTANAFAPSSTTMWGGASRRLATLLRQEYTVGHKGVAFLAHPVAHESGSGFDRLGPDLIPYSSEQLDDAFRNLSVLGLQLWNEDVRLRSSRDNAADLSPTNATGEWQTIDLVPQFSSIANGLAAFDRMLLWSVDSRHTSTVTGLPAGRFRKLFLAGGSDAHGDLNYARKGYAFGLGSVSDLAIGKPRNIVMVPTRSGRQLTAGGVTTQALSQGDVVNGLSSGQFVVTDGPLVRIVADVNGNGFVDDADVPMGGDVSWSEFSPTLRFIVEWKSTAEFGRVTKIDLTVNAFTESTGLGLTYQPLQSGVFASLPSAGIPWKVYTSNSGQTFQLLNNRTLLDPTPGGQLTILVPNAEGYSGRRVVTLDPSLFKTATLDTVRVTCPTAKVAADPQPPEPSPEDEICSANVATNVRTPSALVVRAVGRTDGVGDIDPTTNRLFCTQEFRTIMHGDCSPRVALTNPIWARYSPTVFLP